MAKEIVHHLYKNNGNGKKSMFTDSQHSKIQGEANYAQFKKENTYLGECDANGTLAEKKKKDKPE
jgi:hypothetical protein